QDRAYRCPEGGCREQELVPARACQFTRQLGTISDGEGTSVDAYDDTLHIGVLQGILQIAERVFPGGSGNGEVVSFKLPLSSEGAVRGVETDFRIRTAEDQRLSLLAYNNSGLYMSLVPAKLGLYRIEPRDCYIAKVPERIHQAIDTAHQGE